jgi:hypothetical protein
MSHVLAIVASGGNGGTVAHRSCYSDNGVTWANGTNPTWSNGVGLSWRGLAYSPSLNVLVAVANNADSAAHACAKSTDQGEAYASVAMPENNAFEAVVWADGLGLFVAVCSSGTHRVFISPDGDTWTARATPSGTEALKGIAWSPDLGVLVAVGSSVCLTSSDGANWTSQTIDAVPWVDVCWCGGSMQKFCAVESTYGRFSISSDAASWSTAAQVNGSQVFQNGTRIAWSNDIEAAIIIGGNEGKLAYTTDFSSWAVVSGANHLDSNPLTMVGWSPQLQLWVTANESYIWTAPTGNSKADWTQHSQPTSAQIWSRFVDMGSMAAPPPPLELTAAFSDESRLDAAPTIIPPVALSAAFTDEATLAAALTIGAPPEQIAFEPIDFTDESTLAVRLSFPISLEAALIDDSTLAAALTVMPPVPPPVQCVVVLTG